MIFLRYIPQLRGIGLSGSIEVLRGRGSMENNERGILTRAT